MTIQSYEPSVRSQLASRVRDIVDDAPDTLSRVRKQLQEFANKQPLAAVVIALTGGFLLARLVARR